MRGGDVNLIVLRLFCWRQFTESNTGVGVGLEMTWMENKCPSGIVKLLLFSPEKQDCRERKEEGGWELDKWPYLYLQGQWDSGSRGFDLWPCLCLHPHAWDGVWWYTVIGKQQGLAVQAGWQGSRGSRIDTHLIIGSGSSS